MWRTCISVTLLTVSDIYLFVLFLRYLASAISHSQIRKLFMNTKIEYRQILSAWKELRPINPWLQFVITIIIGILISAFDLWQGGLVDRPVNAVFYFLVGWYICKWINRSVIKARLKKRTTPMEAKPITPQSVSVQNRNYADDDRQS